MSNRSVAVLAAISIWIAAPAFAGDPIQVQRNVPYLDETIVATKVLNECVDLGTKLATFLNQFATKYGVETVLVDAIDPTGPGRVLQVQITNVHSSGNAFIGHQKSMSAKAELFVDGESQEYVNFSRNSSGGIGAGFKGSCSVLGRCSKTLGNDIAKWLRDRQ